MQSAQGLAPGDVKRRGQLTSSLPQGSPKDAQRIENAYKCALRGNEWLSRYCGFVTGLGLAQAFRSCFDEILDASGSFTVANFEHVRNQIFHPIKREEVIDQLAAICLSVNSSGSSRYFT